jgi:hypothetical protein
VYKESSSQVWNEYQETSRGGSAMKLDRILKRRMRAFMKAREAKLREETKS